MGMNIPLPQRPFWSRTRTWSRTRAGNKPHDCFDTTQILTIQLFIRKGAVGSETVGSPHFLFTPLAESTHFKMIFENHPSSVTIFSNLLKISVININFYQPICHYLSLFTSFLMVFRLKTVTLQALFSKSHTDKRVLTRKQTILPLTTNYQKSAFKPKITQKWQKVTDETHICHS